MSLVGVAKVKVQTPWSLATFPHRQGQLCRLCEERDQIPVSAYDAIELSSVEAAMIQNALQPVNSLVQRWKRESLKRFIHRGPLIWKTSAIPFHSDPLVGLLWPNWMENLALVRLPSCADLVAIGGLYNGKNGRRCWGSNEGQRSHPTPQAVRSAVFFRQRIHATGSETTDFRHTSGMFSLHPPTLGGSGQWLRL